jgi:hypothetical protein
MAYRHTTISFPRAVLVMSVVGFTFLPVAWFSWCFLSNRSCCSFLKAACTERLPDKVPANPYVSPSPSSSWRGRKFQEWSMLLLCVPSLLSFQRRPTPPQCPDTHFSNPDKNPAIHLWSPAWWFSWRPLHRLNFNWQLTAELSHSPTSFFTSLHSTELMTTLTNN